ncbi:cytochrome c biogenesis protein ResB [Janibacter sp. G1551]|uniref:cytochrome c biogenesis protein ResB n=1 Tax=Janibacter sp. G1551 TaxID=3420440 RepID=UPI003CFDF873
MTDKDSNVTRRTDPRDVTQPRLGPVGWARWAWRQLTSMRTALFLLLLLAVGAVPGSIWPQRSLDATRTADYIAQHPTLGPWLDRLGMFEVYASPWFSAIYLLLFISLVGCVLPRSRQHWAAMRSVPPRAPKRLTRLPAHVEMTLDATPAETLEAARVALRRKRMRVHAHDAVSVSAEGGYLKETGNLVFHLSLVLLIVGVAYGHLLGWKADIIVPEGKSFASTVTRFDTFAPGPWVDESSLTPFTMRVDSLTATFEDRVTSKGQFGQPRNFDARVTTTDEPGGVETKRKLAVNHPVDIGGASVYLLGNGYAPVITVKDAKGEVLYTGPTPFLSQDTNYKSVGAIKIGGATPKQLGLVGLFLPTAIIDEETGPSSVFPDDRDPALALSLYEGELFPGGRPQSVFTLDTESMDKVLNADGSDITRLWVKPGDTVTLPGGRGTLTFEKVTRWAGLSVRHDPGKTLTLVASLAALAGLITSLTVRRRRVFVRIVEGDGAAVDGVGAGTRLVIGGMSKGDDDGLQDLVDDVAQTLSQRSATLEKR